MFITAKQSDLDQITRLHVDALGDTPNSQVGSWLIRKLYSITIDMKESKVLLYKEKGKVLGIISVTSNMQKGFDNILRKFSVREAFQIISAMLMHPSILKNQVKHKLFMLSSRRYLPNTYTGIMTIAVDSHYRRKNIGSRLIQRIDSLVKIKKDSIYVDTYSDNRRALHFYFKNGYQVVFSAFGNTMLKKVL